MNDHFCARKPRVHSEKEAGPKCCTLGLLESDVDCPKADEKTAILHISAVSNERSLSKVASLVNNRAE
ncbi:hypothetical protein [Bradyrhizobium sacchari]|uniref:hypothetical protein n=1 Tax=Bradyrhizobium sacchari TaxID=1399419 RepID=UPI00142F106B|nr:hypothetical protein [Bradyrhizobium sacchari]